MAAGRDACGALLTWLQTFDPPSPCAAPPDLASGVTLAHVLHKIDPSWFDETWLGRIRGDTEGSTRLKVNNLRQVLQSVLEYWQDVLGQAVAEQHVPDVAPAARHGDPEQLGKLVRLVLGCAVSCPRREEHIQRIMTLEESVQHEVMAAIQELLDPEPSEPMAAETYGNFDTQSRRYYYLSQEPPEEGSGQRCHELEQQVAALQEEKGHLAAENRALREQLESDAAGAAAKKLLRLQTQVEELQEENYRLESGREELRARCSRLEEEARGLQARAQELSGLAGEARALRANAAKAPLGSEGWLGEPPPRQDPAGQEAMLRALDAGLERCLALHSAVQCIPVPRHRKLSGKAGIDEVMAAAVLTSLSASPLVLGHPPATHAPEPGSEVWKEAPAMSSSCSSSSNTSGDWSWDPSSDRSTPSTPSPPLSSHVPSTFLPGPLPDEGPDEPDGTHFVFGEPTPRKRKNSTKVMFKCLWKSCGKVLSSSSGMQKHIRTMHLGRKADLEQSDGEEDFYYTELDVDVDALTDGLSSLTPVSPTSSVPPAFPGPEAPLLPALPTLELALASPCSPPGLPGRCHVHTDHAYQGCRTPPRPPVSPTVPTPPPPKPPAVPRRPRGEAKKCRKVYGMEHREMWCTACRWKKACQRFLD